MICVGSSLVVYPVAGLPQLTLERGGRLAIVTAGRDALRRGCRAEAGRRGRRRAEALLAALGYDAAARAQNLMPRVLQSETIVSARAPLNSAAWEQVSTAS